MSVKIPLKVESEDRDLYSVQLSVKTNSGEYLKTS